MQQGLMEEWQFHTTFSVVTPCTQVGQVKTVHNLPDNLMQTEIKNIRKGTFSQKYIQQPSTVFIDTPTTAPLAYYTIISLHVSTLLCVSLQTHSTQHTQLRTGHVILNLSHTHILTLALTACARTKEYVFYVNILYTF